MHATSMLQIVFFKFLFLWKVIFLLLYFTTPSTNKDLQIDTDSRRTFSHYIMTNVSIIEPVRFIKKSFTKNKPLPSTNMSKNPSTTSLKPSGQSTALQNYFTNPYFHFVGTQSTFAQCSVTNCSSTCNETDVRFRSRCVFNCRRKKIFKRCQRLGDCTMSEADLTKVDCSL